MSFALIFLPFIFQDGSANIKLLAFLFQSLQKNSDLPDQTGGYLQDSFRINTIIPFTEEVTHNLHILDTKVEQEKASSFIIREPSTLNYNDLTINWKYKLANYNTKTTIQIKKYWSFFPR